MGRGVEEGWTFHLSFFFCSKFTPPPVRLIHTVDHVEGVLRGGFDALDAFVAHAWAVTVTGAPKLWAMQFVEENEETPRLWYAGAVGFFAVDG